jgi:Zn-dependent peptidase ImmA (M78 family)
MTPEGRAALLLHAHGVTAFPVDVEGIARAEGVKVAGVPHNGPEYSLALRDGKLLMVGINNKTNAPRQRCAVAHGLGHLLLHQAVILVCRISRSGSPPDARSTPSALEEVEANAFSAALVMPGDTVAEMTAGISLGQGAAGCTAFTGEVARLFGVPAEVAAYRLAALGLLAT